MMEQLTLEQFEALPEGKPFAFGTVANNPDGAFMTTNFPDRMLRWIAKKGYGNDFAIYCLWDEPESNDDLILTGGNKITFKPTVQKLLNCTDEVLERMRR